MHSSSSSPPTQSGNSTKTPGVSAGPGWLRLEPSWLRSPRQRTFWPRPFFQSLLFHRLFVTRLADWLSLPRHPLFVTIGLCLVLAGSCGWRPSSSSTATSSPAETATVEFVIDGDTVDLIIDGQEERVRLIGIDTPETKARDTPIQCFGEEASAALRGLLPIGSTVRIERDDEPRDRFGRLLLYLYRVDDDLFINRWMVENGFANAVSYRPNITFEAEFRAVEAEAQSAGRGLWASCDGPDQPLDDLTGSSD